MFIHKKQEYVHQDLDVYTSKMTATSMLVDYNFCSFVCNFSAEEQRQLKLRRLQLFIIICENITITCESDCYHLIRYKSNLFKDIKVKVKCPLLQDTRQHLRLVPLRTMWLHLVKLKSRALSQYFWTKQQWKSTAPSALKLTFNFGISMETATATLIWNC